MSSRTKMALMLAMAGPLSLLGQSAAPDTGAGTGAGQMKPAVALPNPDSSGIYRVGGGVLPPKPVHTEEPRFSDKARRKRVEGNCTVSMVVDVQGNPQSVHIVRSVADGVAAKLRPVALTLDDNAIAAAKAYRFEPAMLHGKPVPVEIAVEISYRLY